jgi:glycosyltransferase involved in cell wall biosynthesis
MAKYKPLLSLLIPTRNRGTYCLNVIQSILKFEYSNFELVVHDNSDDKILSSFISDNIDDERFIYKYSSAALSTIGNVNAVIDLAKGDYLCMIGDDDGVTHDIFSLVEWMKKNSIDAVKPSLSLMYRWPDACEILPSFRGDKGNLEIINFTGNIEVYDVNKELDLLLSNGGQNYLMRQLPKLYHGIVSKEKLETVKETTGNYTGGLSPDIYWVGALSNLIEQIYVIDYPVTISGVCAAPLKQGGHLSKIEKLEDAPHFRARGKYEWSQVVPRFYCAENIWADSFFAALKDNKMYAQQSKFNLTYLSALLYNKYPKNRELIVSNYKKNAKFILARNFPICILLISSKWIKFTDLFNRALRKLKVQDKTNNFLMIQSLTYRNVSSIFEANSLLKRNFEKSNISLDKLLSNYNKI